MSFLRSRAVNFYFDYPLHPVDTEGALASFRPEGSPLGNLDSSSKRTTPEVRKRRLDEAFEAAPKNEPITIKTLAEIAGVSQDTMRRYLKNLRTSTWSIAAPFRRVRCFLAHPKSLNVPTNLAQHRAFSSENAKIAKPHG